VYASGDKRVFSEYHISQNESLDPEERNLEMLYRNRRAFAVGHGCAADWAGEKDGCVSSLQTRVIPETKVPPVIPRSEPHDAYSMYFLSRQQNEEDIPDTLGKLVKDYGEWINGLENAKDGLGEAADENIAKCRACQERIESGIKVLREDATIREAFMLMNEAMLRQQVHYARPHREPGDDNWEVFPESYEPAEGSYRGRWRCFQLAFILMDLPCFLENPVHRETVDLIWFPTGGGKTEAYLGLSAFVMFLRRLRNNDNSGCSVIMRYTLRLLTAQQFQRAAAMICACERIRLEHKTIKDGDCFSIGMWVGQSLTPNSNADAGFALNSFISGYENKFQLLTCPWCGTALDNRDRPGYKKRTNPLRVEFKCPEDNCPFFSTQDDKYGLPVVVVDEQIYRTPPSLIIGTVDKFAMLAWRPEAGAIFGLKTGNSTAKSPPELIIQDELHLISGPLGSMVGLYESVIEKLCSHDGTSPKIVASTATVRRAADQCRALYNRDACIFPPQGLDISDSFYAKEKPDAPGRIYLGILPTASPSSATANRRIAAALLQASKTVSLEDEPEEDHDSIRDAYWTLVWYFNSRRELASAYSLCQIDIPEHLKELVKRQGDFKNKRLLGSPVEMSSRLTAGQIPGILKQLEQELPAKTTVNTLLTTNMISVGVDISRLGLMAVTGQPKTTSEYIQATSRVGRDERAPGLVVTLYGPAKSRDRSHYEHFRAYHESFYRYVEPSSVTPFSIPALERALHALIVIASRHLWKCEKAQDFDPQRHAPGHLKEWLLERCSNIAPEHCDFLEELFDTHINNWEDRAEFLGAWGTPMQKAESDWLMYSFDKDPPTDRIPPWPTMTSLRGVDVECEIRVVDEYEASGDEDGKSKQ
ncbi:MAG: helicase, partial [Planctomycetota bacterium]